MMTRIDPATPFVSLEAVVMDTETTGLDADKARIVQIAAFRVTGETFDPSSAFERLVRPDIPIPPASTAIHGIGDQDVADAQTAGETLPDLARFLGEAVIIGHTIGYDLTILQREAERAGLSWRHYPSLDIRLLARVANPDLADYGLDQLCAWLNIPITGRHTAMGDALATAKVFSMLVPLLRRKGIRTIADSDRASRQLDERLIAAGGALPFPISLEERDDLAAPRRIDSYPYTHRIHQVMSAPPVTLEPDRSLGDALDVLMLRGVSSVFVVDEDGLAGIVTERDLLRHLHEKGPVALEQTLDAVRSMPLQSVSRDAFVYRAIGRMDRFAIRHLGVHDDEGRIVGAVTTRNLLRHRSSAAMVLGDEISTADDLSALAKAWTRLPLMARQLSQETVDPLTLAAVISSEIRVLTRRAAQIGELDMEKDGWGAAPVPYAVMVLGSAGRGESLLAADQDNAIVYRSGEAGGPEDRWFEELGTRIANLLDGAGVPYCSGGVMAKNTNWRKSEGNWRQTIDHWVALERPEDLLNVDIFFDAVPVHGDHAMGENLWAYAYEKGARAPAFRRALSHHLRDWRRPVGLFGGIRTDSDGRVDLKIGGLMPIFTAARVMSIKNSIMARGTPERLRGTASAGLASMQQMERLVEAQRILLGAVLRQQIEDFEEGIPLSAKVRVAGLSKTDLRALRQALGTVGETADLAGEGVL